MTKSYHGIEIPGEPIREFCTRNHVQRLSLFGSILRSDFSQQSDVDILIEFTPGRVPGLFRMVSLESELSRLLGRKVDLRTPAELSRRFREQVLHEAEAQFVAA